MRIDDIYNKQTFGSVENKDNSREKQSRPKRNWAYGICMAIIHALGVGAIVGLSVALHFSQEKLASQVNYQNQMESVYARAYYSLLDGVNDMDTTLAKLTIAKSREKQESLLYDIWCASTLAEEYLATFGNSDEGVRTAVKYINQLGDYSLHLADKLSRGEQLTEKDRATPEKMRPMAGMLKESLQKINGDLNEGKLFMEDNGILKEFSKAFSSFAEPDFNYPQMIYDGPFSDGLETASAKGLEGLEDIDQKKGEKIIGELFDGVSEIEYIGRFDGRIPTENYSFKINGKTAFVQLSTKGGKVINFSLAETKDSDNEISKNAGEKAVAFAKQMGYKNMQVVWSATAHGHTYINLAPVEEGIILYPDLVKVKIDNESGEIIGFDSAHHAYNHRKRNLEKPAIAESDARNNLSIQPIAEGRLALIPEGGGQKETLCYEYQCESEGTYFVYIDALTGAETEILYVIDDTDQGQSLM
ncbi:MAG: germination protein YpeB [Clostridia bacterium]|nr:germination protein YpeB [Clostridia bacterium]